MFRTESAEKGVGEELQEADSYEIIIEQRLSSNSFGNSSTDDFSRELRKISNGDPGIGPKDLAASSFKIPRKA